MDNVALAKINSFGETPKTDNVPLQEQPAVFVLSSSQLSDIINRAIEEARQSFKVELLEYRAIVDNQTEKITTLESTVNTLSDNQLIQLRLIHELRESSKKVPGKTEASRAEKIEKYLASRPDHRASFETLKGNLGVDKARLHEAIKTLMKGSPGRYGIIRVPGDKRKRVLVMLPK
jgi:hypothetical protein